MAILISFGLFLALTGVITLFGYSRYVKPGRFYARLNQSGAAALISPVPRDGRFFEVLNLVERVGVRVPLSRRSAGLIRKLLLQAGYRQDRAFSAFVGIKVCAAATMGAAAFLIQSMLGCAALPGMVLTITAAFTGFVLPGIILRRRATGRRERLRLSLPDALDLLVVCVESGVGIDQAMRYVSRELELTHRDISEELSLVSLEMLAGERRSDAMTSMAERTGEDEIRKLVAVLVQTDRFGTSVADALRTHADALRVRRRQLAEERANKISVKLVFPIFFFLLPAILVVAAGPGMLAIQRQLLPALRQMHS